MFTIHAVLNRKRVHNATVFVRRVVDAWEMLIHEVIRAAQLATAAAAQLLSLPTNLLLRRVLDSNLHLKVLILAVGDRVLEVKRGPVLPVGFICGDKTQRTQCSAGYVHYASTRVQLQLEALKARMRLPAVVISAIVVRWSEEMSSVQFPVLRLRRCVQAGTDRCDQHTEMLHKCRGGRRGRTTSTGFSVATRATHSSLSGIPEAFSLTYRQPIQHRPAQPIQHRPAQSL